MINCLTKFSFHLRVISFAVSDATELLECNRVNGERVYRDTRTPHLAHMDTMLEKRSFNELVSQTELPRVLFLFRLVCFRFPRGNI